jgi:hypothetical protein
MALPVYSLGSFDFKVLESLAGFRGGAPELPQKHLDFVQRPGVPGTGFIDLAIKGSPFQMRSLVDVADESGAQSLVEEYFLAVGGDKLAMVWRDNDIFALHGVMYEVVRFEAPRMRRMACITGGLNVAPGATGVVVEGIWTLWPDVIDED